jgi:hypothetical protein
VVFVEGAEVDDALHEEPRVPQLLRLLLEDQLGLLELVDAPGLYDQQQPAALL